MLRSMNILSANMQLFLVVCLCSSVTGITIMRNAEAGGQAALPSEWTDCGAGATVLTVSNVIMTPDPVKSGANFTLSLECTGSDDITAGTFVTQVFLAGIAVHKESDDICSKVSCPIKAGNTVIKSVNNMPAITPHGRYRIVVTGATQDGLPDICAEIFFTVE